MKPILWFDSVGGASGDMILAALIDLGASVDILNAGLQNMGLTGLRIEAVPHTANGLRGTKVIVREQEHHTHGAHGHPPHRGLPEIRRLIGDSALPEPVRNRAVAVFERLAAAEGRVHGKPPDEIHFHEVGALDSIADIVGSCLALSLLHAQDTGFSPLPLGHGTIQCAHGTLPNPPPATVELLKGFPITHADEPYELVTPTGAALLTAWRTLDGIPEAGIIRKVGHGFGQRTLKTRPNLLRALLIEPPDAPPALHHCLVLETNIDDTTPELIGALAGKLMARGALDVFTIPVQMKKQRPAVMLTVLCAPGDRETMLDLIFTESSTFGVRETLVRRTMLARESRTVETPFGPVRIKVGAWKGRNVTASPEYDDCVKNAESRGVAVKAVYEAAAEAWRAVRGSDI